MTTESWVKRHIEFAIKQDKTLEELRISLQTILTRLDLSPLEDKEKEAKRTFPKIIG